MTINVGQPELSLLRAKLVSLESRLEEETTTHAHTRELLENMPVMMNAFDDDGMCVAWNLECERITGYSALEMIGNPDVPDLVMPDPVYRARMMERCPSKQNVREWEVYLVTKDGRRLTIAWSNVSEICPVPGWDIWAIGVDVTTRNHALKQLRSGRLELEQQVRQRTAELELANEQLRRQVAEQESVGAALKGRK
ncbi:MAG: PAS domain S-box protein [Proteobacteria bacterium]|nr:PAS domain S-box protein [Pseudomonadota bacterium]